MRNVPDFIIYLTGFSSALFITCWTIYYTHNRPLSMRFLYAGIAFGIFTGGFYFINDYRKAQTNSGPIDQNKNSNTYRNNSSLHLQPPRLNPIGASKPNKQLKKPESSHQQITSTKNNPLPTQQINAPNSAISIGQSGGVTAHTINVGQQERRVTPDQQAIIVRNLKPLQKDQIDITYSSGSPEQKKFAESLIAPLKAAGFEVNDKSSMMSITPYGGGLSFVVNSTLPHPKGAAVLQKALLEAKIESIWYGSPEMNRDKIWIVIGER